MQLKHADKLSEPARALLAAGASGYQRLVVSDGHAADRGIRDRIETLAMAGVLAQPLANLEHADTLLAGLWLWHDFLDESHSISQGIDSPTGSFWHAIM